MKKKTKQQTKQPKKPVKQEKRVIIDEAKQV